MNARLVPVLALVPLLLSACGSGGSDDSAAVGAAAFAGLWDAREFHGGARDERYVAISADGRYTEYDYRQDGLADDGNCYLVSELRLERTTSRDLELGGGIGADGSLTDADPILVENAPTFTLSDGRTITLFRSSGYPGGFLGPEGEVVEVDSIDLLSGRIEDDASSLHFDWTSVTGLSTADLTPCTDV